MTNSTRGPREKGQVSRDRGTYASGTDIWLRYVEEVAALETPKKWGHSEERGVPLARARAYVHVSEWVCVRSNEVPDSSI